MCIRDRLIGFWFTKDSAANAGKKAFIVNRIGDFGFLIAMYGRKDGPKAATKFFLFTFIPSAPFLVAILWLYSTTGSFDFVTLQILSLIHI